MLRTSVLKALPFIIYQKYTTLFLARVRSKNNLDDFLLPVIN